MGSGVFGDLMRSKLKAKLDELPDAPPARGGNGIIQKTQATSSPRVHGQAGQRMCGAAERAMGRALMPSLRAPQEQPIEKAAPAPPPRVQVRPTAALGTLKTMEHALLATQLSFFIENGQTFEKDMLEGMTMLRDALLENGQ